MKENHLHKNLAEFRDCLQGLHGKKYWRSLEELAESEEFQQAVQNEFPQDYFNWNQPLVDAIF